MTSQTASPDLERAIADSLEAYANGENRFFDYLTDDVRVFNLNDPQPMIGRRQFEESFAEGFRLPREVRVISADLQPMKDSAILSQTLEVRSEGVSAFIRQTVVWRQEGGEWRIGHVHNAMVGQPTTDELPQNPDQITVLREKIATVATAVGVAQ
ncbi:nuclear transport factor 2 family protein [Streptosporangium sp. NPDC049376]|uniref:nuclear transport factor 2 family protein n=1 Tax=Streptosporangium sp. NPDC049376 TaxID=3366192 RepID=UPI003793F850